ncbi:MAG: DUF302 domain-containing protein [Pseudomonadota bacterium]
MKAVASTVLGLGLAACAGFPAPETMPAPKVIESVHDFKNTIERLDAAVSKRPLKVFSVIDHAGGAASIGASLAPSRLLIFGNPEVGTPFIQANPAFGHELPLKILVFTDTEGTKVVYPDIVALSAAYGIDPEEAPVEQVATSLQAIVEEASR